MDLGGNLTVIEPSMVFQFFNTCSISGLLKFINVKSVANFYFKDGNLVYATSDSRRKIGEYLLEKEVITEKQLRGALKAFHHEKGLSKLGEILIQRGYIKKETLTNVLREQMEEAVYDVLNWKDGQFVFFKSVEPEETDIFLADRMDRLMLEGFRRIDEAAEVS
ncbi:MAG: DUF4388 domain-containing protein [Planctomycetota bacterium]|jgi:hypothetical protein